MTTHHCTLKTALALALTVSTIAPAAASARFDNNPVYLPKPAAKHLATIAAARLVRTEFTDQLQRQAQLAGDTVQIQSFNCSYAYTYGGATYFTCHAKVRVQTSDQSTDPELSYWLLVTGTPTTISWSIEHPDPCSTGYALC